jgi:membrane protease YdiL (CAAX protease family)
MPTSRIPNLLHFLFFLGLVVFAFLLSEAAILALTHNTQPTVALASQKLQLFAELSTYLIALGASFFIFPVFWQRPFLTGLQWNPAKATLRLAALGLLLGFAAQALSVLIPHPKDLPIEDLFKNPHLIWSMAAFGILLGPLFEEVLFRGFLLPAIAIAVDYLRIPRDPDPLISLENLIAWRSTSSFSTLALTISSILTSLLFAVLHAPQLAFTWPAVALLACFSLILCAVRIRTGSVAASTLVHCCYNLTIFLSLFAATSGFRHLDRV